MHFFRTITANVCHGTVDDNYTLQMFTIIRIAINSLWCYDELLHVVTVVHICIITPVCVLAAPEVLQYEPITPAADMWYVGVLLLSNYRHTAYICMCISL